MSASELKTDLINLLGTIDNEQLLRTVYDFVKQHEQNDDGGFWSSLPDEVQQEVYLSYQESENDANLKSWNDLKTKY